MQDELDNPRMVKKMRRKTRTFFRAEVSMQIKIRTCSGAEVSYGNVGWGRDVQKSLTIVTRSDHKRVTKSPGRS